VVATKCDSTKFRLHALHLLRIHQRPSRTKRPRLSEWYIRTCVGLIVVHGIG
jgi:hypothetical protein